MILMDAAGRRSELVNDVCAGGDLRAVEVIIEDVIQRVIPAELGANRQVPAPLVIGERNDVQSCRDRPDFRCKPASAVEVVKILAAGNQRPNAWLVELIADVGRATEPY